MSSNDVCKDGKRQLPTRYLPATSQSSWSAMWSALQVRGRQRHVTTTRTTLTNDGMESINTSWYFVWKRNSPKWSYSSPRLLSPPRNRTILDLLSGRQIFATLMSINSSVTPLSLKVAKSINTVHNSYR